MDKENSITQQSILFGIIGLLLGIVLALLFARNAVNNNMGGMMRMMGIRQNQEMMGAREEMMMEHEGLGMQDMIEALKGKTGDEFDKTFVELMIEHHQGAIDMANLVKTNAKHQEVKDLAQNIISAQTQEIEMMQKWQKDWRY